MLKCPLNNVWGTGQKCLGLKRSVQRKDGKPNAM